MGRVSMMATTSKEYNPTPSPMKVWLVEIQHDENIPLPPQFETEVFSTERRARLRTEKLNRERPQYCGYWFNLSDARTVNSKNKDW